MTENGIGDFLPRYKSGYYFTNPMTGGNAFAWSANTAYFVPFQCFRRQVFDRISINVTGAQASSNARLGVYTVRADGSLNSLVYGSAALATTGTGEVSESGTIVLPAGWYFLAGVNSHAITTNSAVSGSPQLGYTAANTATTPVTCFTASFTYGELPVNFSASLSAGTSTMPRIMLRAK